MNLPIISERNDLADKVVFVRGGMNVSLNEQGEIEDSFRLAAILPTLRFLQSQKAKIIL
jgi:3-phosphoglycerate kinase